MRWSEEPQTHGRAFSVFDAGSDVSMLGDKATEVAARLQLVRRGQIGKY